MTDNFPKNIQRKKWHKPFAFIIIILPLLGGLAGTAYFYAQYREAKDNPQKLAQAEITDIVSKAGKLITLPKDEVPTLATVNDHEKLKQQPFFADTKNGDKLLIYTEAKKAIIYRADENIIINVGPLVLNASETN